MKIELLGKPDCHLCAEAKRVLDKVCSKLSLPWNQINIENHPQFFELYKEEIPVLLIDGRKAFKYRIEEEALLKILSRWNR